MKHVYNYFTIVKLVSRRRVYKTKSTPSFYGVDSFVVRVLRTSTVHVVLLVVFAPNIHLCTDVRMTCRRHVDGSRLRGPGSNSRSCPSPVVIASSVAARCDIFSQMSNDAYGGILRTTWETSNGKIKRLPCQIYNGKRAWAVCDVDNKTSRRDERKKKRTQALRRTLYFYYIRIKSFKNT